jgi:glycosyltransferase involved in cell wall biosynthesis
VGGTETYAVSLTRSLVAESPNTEFVALLNWESHELALGSYQNLRTVYCPVKAINRTARYKYEQLQLPIVARQNRLDVLHSLGYVSPLHCDCPTVVTIHDMHASHTPSLQRRFVRTVFETLSAACATQIITPSFASKRELVSKLHISAEKINVVNFAPKSFEQPTDSQTHTQAAIAGGKQEYILAFCSTYPHKNIPRLVQAFRMMSDVVPANLVLVGNFSAEIEQLVAATNALVGNRIQLLGYVNDVELAHLLAGASMLVFPSFYEGFGLPVLEAQALGVPVACSLAASLPEVAGDAAVYFDPYDVTDIANAISLVLNQLALQTSLQAKGFANVQRFSWARAAQETYAVYERCLS